MLNATTRGIDIALIEPGPELTDIGLTTRKQRAGRLLSYYHREAA